MITAVRLLIAPDKALPAATLVQFTEMAERRGHSPNELLAELIRREAAELEAGGKGAAELEGAGNTRHREGTATPRPPAGRGGGA